MSSGSIVPASRWFRHWWPLLVLGAAAGLVVAFIATAWWIQGSAMEVGDAAAREFRGDRVEALMAYVESDRHTLAERNRAVWALGQLRDRRALPVLERHRTGRPCDHARFLCQQEVEKAIALCRAEGVRGWITRALKVD
jgi:hypothetical protein